jgi:hypothetical protein
MPSKHAYIKTNIYFIIINASREKCFLNKPHMNGTDNSLEVILILYNNRLCHININNSILCALIL